MLISSAIIVGLKTVLVLMICKKSDRDMVAQSGTGKPPEILVGG